jgi:hypothetical protein
MMMLSFFGFLPDNTPNQKKALNKPTAQNVPTPARMQGEFYAPFGGKYTPQMQPVAKTGIPKATADEYTRRALGASSSSLGASGSVGAAPPASQWPPSKYGPDDNNRKKYNGYKAFFVDGVLMAPIRQLLSPTGLLMAGVGIGVTALTGPGILPFFALAGLGASGYEFFKGFKQYGKAETAKQRAEALKTLGASLSDGFGALMGIKATALAAKLPHTQQVSLWKEPSRFLRSSVEDLSNMLKPDTLKLAWGQVVTHTQGHQSKLHGALTALRQGASTLRDKLPRKLPLMDLKLPWQTHTQPVSANFKEPPLAIRLSDIPHATQETLQPLQQKASGWFAQVGQAVKQRVTQLQNKLTPNTQGEVTHGMAHSASSTASQVSRLEDITLAPASTRNPADVWEAMGVRQHAIPLEHHLPKWQGKLDALRTFMTREDWHVTRGITTRSTQGNPWGHPAPPRYLQEQLHTLSHIVGGTPQESIAWGRMGAKEVKALRLHREDSTRGFWQVFTQADDVKPKLSTSHGDYAVKLQVEQGAYVLPSTLQTQVPHTKKLWIPEHSKVVATHIDEGKKLVHLTLKAVPQEQRLKHSLQHYVDNQALYRNHYRHLATEQPQVWQQLQRHARGSLYHDLTTHAHKLGGHASGTKTYFAGIPAGVDPTKLQTGSQYHDVIPLTLYEHEASALGAVGQKSGLLLKLAIPERAAMLTRRQLQALGVRVNSGDGLLLPSSTLQLQSLAQQGKLSTWQVLPMGQLPKEGLALQGKPLPVDIQLAETEGPWFPMLSGLLGHPQQRVQHFWQNQLRDPIQKTLGGTYRWGHEAFVRPLERVGTGQGQWGWDLSRMTFELGAVTGVARGALDVARHHGTGVYSTSVHRVLGQGVTQSLTMGTLGTGGGMLGSYTGANLARYIGWGKSHAWNEQAVHVGQTLGGVLGGTAGTVLGAQAARLPMIQALGNMAVSTVLWVPTTLLQGGLGLLGLGTLGVAGTGFGLAKGTTQAFKWALN